MLGTARVGNESAARRTAGWLLVVLAELAPAVMDSAWRHPWMARHARSRSARIVRSSVF